MSDGYVSLATGDCVPTIEQAAQSLCGGFPQLAFGQYGIEGETTCRIDYESGNPLAFVTFEHYQFGGYQWGDARQVPIAQCDVRPSSWDLSVSDALLVSGAIVGVWLVAWGFRAIRAVLS